MRLEQASLFDILPTHEAQILGLAGVMPEIKARMNAIASQDEEGRKRLPEKISNIAQRERVALTASGAKTIKVDVLDKWVQPKNSSHDPSLMGILCFCLATGSSMPIKPVLDKLNLTVICKHEEKYLEYGKLCWEMREARDKKKKLESQL